MREAIKYGGPPAGEAKEQGGLGRVGLEKVSLVGRNDNWKREGRA